MISGMGLNFRRFEDRTESIAGQDRMAVIDPAAETRGSATDAGRRAARAGEGIARPKRRRAGQAGAA